MGYAARFFGYGVRHVRGGLLNPLFITYLATLRCNARCRICASWKTRDETRLDCAALARVFEGLPRPLAVRVSGGEPFVLDDLEERLALITRIARPPILHVTTNGIATDKIVQVVAKAATRPGLHVKVSIDGLQEHHERLRGPGTFAPALATVRALARLRQHRGFYLGVNQVLTGPDPLCRYQEVRALVSSFEVPLHAYLAFQDPPLYRDSDETFVTPRYRDDYPEEVLAPLLNELYHDTRRIPSVVERWVAQYYLMGVYRRCIQKTALPRPRCTALRGHLRLMPDGSIPVCYFRPRRVGTLPVNHSTTLELAAARREVDACPGCWADCETTPSAIIGGDLLRSRVRLLGRHGPRAFWIGQKRLVSRLLPVS